MGCVIAKTKVILGVARGSMPISLPNLPVKRLGGSFESERLCVT